MGFFDFDVNAVAAAQDIESREYNIYQFANHLIVAVREVLSSSAQGGLAEPGRLYIESDGSLHTYSSQDIASGAYAQAVALFNREMAEFISEGYGIYNGQWFLFSNQVLQAAEAELREEQSVHEATGGAGQRVGGAPWDGSPAGGAQSSGGGAGGGAGPGGGGAGGGMGQGGGTGGQPAGRTTGGTGAAGIPPPVRQEFIPGTDNLAIGATSQRVSGPFEVGREGDKHMLGADRDANPINSTHLSVYSLFFRDSRNDAPLWFEFDVEYPETRPKYYVPCHIRYDEALDHPFVSGRRPGLWRIQGRCHFTQCTGVPEPPPDYMPDSEPFDSPLNPIRTWAPGHPGDRPVFTPNMLMSPGGLFRAQPLGPNWSDFRNSMVDHPYDTWRLTHQAPVVARVEGFVSMTGNEFNYTQRPGESRYRGGSANGGVAYLPPEVDMADYVYDFAPGNRSLSTTYHVALPGVYWAGGYPVPSTGKVKTGYRWGTNATGDLKFERLDSSGVATEALKLSSAGLLTGNGGTLWSSGNDGIGSGLDADLLDGLDSTAFALAAHTHSLDNLSDVTIAGVATGDYLRKSAGDWVNVTVAQLLTDLKTVDGSGSGLDADTLDGLDSSSFASSSHTHTLNDLSDVTISGVATGDYVRKSAGDWVNVTISQLLTDLKTVDGSGSGLDADLLDGISSAGFALATHATQHQSGGSDSIKLDDLAAPDDNTDLNASTSAHGLLKKLSNVATEFMNGQGNWATPSFTETWTTVKKQTTETINNDTTIGADADLKFTMEANKDYSFELVVFTDSAAAADFKWRHVGPSAPAAVQIARETIAPDDSVYSGIRIDSAYSSSDVTVLSTTNTKGYIRMRGTIHNGANAGDFEFHWAQNTLSASNTSVLKGSWLKWMQVSA